MPCSKSALDARYMPKVPDPTQPKEMFILHPFWDLAGSCDMPTRIDGRPCEDQDDNQLGGVEECEIATRNSRAS